MKPTFKGMVHEVHTTYILMVTLGMVYDFFFYQHYIIRRDYTNQFGGDYHNSASYIPILPGAFQPNVFSRAEVVTTKVTGWWFGAFFMFP